MSAIAMIVHGALPAVRIASADGALAIVTLYGAHVVSWQTADGAERLFCSAKSAMDGSRAIRGGIPIIFPQFAERGDGMRHGFARVSTWRLAGSGMDTDGAWAEFTLAPADIAPAIASAWPHAFHLTLRVAVDTERLTLTLDVRNDGADDFDFAAALHTYFQVHDLAGVAIEGIEKGKLRLAEKIDRIYRQIGRPITLTHEGGLLTLEQQGFGDAVVWNPGQADTAALADMDNEEYRHFVCIEPARVDAAPLAGGATWRGAHQVTARTR